MSTADFAIHPHATLMPRGGVADLYWRDTVRPGVRAIRAHIRPRMGRHRPAQRVRLALIKIMLGFGMLAAAL